MKRETRECALAMRSMPRVILSFFDGRGQANAMADGFVANVSIQPPMMMAGVMPGCFAHELIKAAGGFAVNLPGRELRDTYRMLELHSGATEAQLKAMGLGMERGTAVNAPLLRECPVSIECRVVSSTTPGTHELFMARVEAVHCDETYLDVNGNIRWDVIDLL